MLKLLLNTYFLRINLIHVFNFMKIITIGGRGSNKDLFRSTIETKRGRESRTKTGRPLRV